MPRRPLGSITNLLFFVFAILLHATHGQHSTVQKGNFLFSTIAESVLVNPAHQTVVRKLDLQSISDSLTKLKAVLITYQDVCVKALRSPGMEPTFVLLQATLSSFDIDTTCRQHKFLPPTVESSKDRQSLEELLKTNGIQQITSPYVSAGPGQLHKKILLKSENGYVPVIPILAVDEATSSIQALYPSVYNLGPMNRLRLNFLSGALNVTTFSSPSSFRPHRLVCRNPSAYRIRPGNMTSSPIVKRLCGTEITSLSDYLAKVNTLVRMLNPKFITQFSFNHSSTSFDFADTPGRKNHSPQKTEQANEPVHYTSYAAQLFRQDKRPARRERAAGAIILGAAAMAILLASAIASAVSLAGLAQANARIDDLARTTDAITLMTQEMKTAAAQMAVHQKEFARSLHLLNSEMMTCVVLLQLSSDFHAVMGNVQFAIGNLLDIVSAARHGNVHEWVMDASFLLKTQGSSTKKLALDPRYVRANLVRNSKFIYLILKIPIIDDKRKGTLLRIDPFPMFQNGKAFFPTFVPSHIVVFTTEDMYGVPKPSELTDCVSRPYDCKISAPLRPPGIPACGPPSYFSYQSKCSYSIPAFDQDFFLSIHKTTYYKVEGRRTLHRLCVGPKKSNHNRRQTYTIQGSGSFVIPPNCITTDLHGLKILGSDDSNSHIHFADILHLGVSPKDDMDFINFTLPELDLRKHEQLLEDINDISLPALLFPSLPSLLEISIAALVVFIVSNVMLYSLLMYRLKRYVRRQLLAFHRIEDLEHATRRAQLRHQQRMLASPPSPPPPPLRPAPSPPSFRSGRHHLRVNPLATIHTSPRRRRQAAAIAAIDTLSLPALRPMTPTFEED